MRTRGGIMVAALAAAAGIVPGTATAARSWHPPIVISPDGAGSGPPAAALGARGEAVAAFTLTTRRSRVEARVRRGVRAAWVPVPLSGTLPRAPSRLAADLDGSGRAAVAWRVPGGGVRVAVRDRRDRPWRVLPVAPTRPADAFYDFWQPALRIGPGGATTLVWAERAGGAWTLRAAARAGTGAFRETAPLPLGAVQPPSVALGDDGAAVAAWTAPPAAAAPLAVGPLTAVRRAPDGSWSTGATLSATALGPAAAIAGGRAVVAWEERAGDPPTSAQVRIAEDVGGGWAPPVDVAAGRSPRVAADGGGDLLVTWAGEPTTAEATPIVASRRTGPDGRLSAAETLTAGRGMSPYEASLARVALSPYGRGFVAWNDPEGPGSATTTLATAAPGAPWATTPIAVGGDDADVSLSLSGADALALVPRAGARSTVIAAVDWDARVRPRLSARARGVRLAGGAVRWTVAVRNPGTIPLRGIRLRVSVCCGARLLSACPAGTPAARPWVAWRLGSLRPGSSRRVRMTIRPARGRTPYLGGEVRAVAVPPQAVSATAR